jgi:hypothetical protein
MSGSDFLRRICTAEPRLQIQMSRPAARPQTMELAGKRDTIVKISLALECTTCKVHGKLLERSTDRDLCHIFVAHVTARLPIKPKIAF